MNKMNTTYSGTPKYIIGQFLKHKQWDYIGQIVETVVRTRVTKDENETVITYVIVGNTKRFEIDEKTAQLLTLVEEK